MIDLYTWPTPNGWKAHIMLEECGLEYTTHEINIGQGDQHKPDFLAISPNNRIPAIVDQDGPDGQVLRQALPEVAGWREPMRLSPAHRTSCSDQPA